MKPPKSIKEIINKIRTKSQFISSELRNFFYGNNCSISKKEIEHESSIS